MDKPISKESLSHLCDEMGKTIHLGIDHSTGEPREDKAEYYEEIKDERMKEIPEL